MKKTILGLLLVALISSVSVLDKPVQAVEINQGTIHSSIGITESKYYSNASLRDVLVGYGHVTRGPAVEQLQRVLTNLSNAAKMPSWNPQGIDSKFGDNTYSALVNYQTSKHIPADGVCGPETLAKIDADIVYYFD